MSPAAGGWVTTRLRVGSSFCVGATILITTARSRLLKVIARLHREHIERQEAIHTKLRDVHERLVERAEEHGGAFVVADMPPPDAAHPSASARGGTATDH